VFENPQQPYLSQSMMEANWMREIKCNASLSRRVLAQVQRLRRQKKFSTR
jgi:hypothetical protein